ncbi:MAG: endonuclease/exonuclease/phosphatase family protein [Armatimonadota bacterium]
MRTTIRVLTMNIWTFTEPYAARMAVLRQGIEALAPDLLAFQEAGYAEGRHQVAEVLDGMSYHILHQYEAAPSAVKDNACCVASRWPFELVEVLPLQVTERTLTYPYAALAVRVASPAGPLLFVCAKPSWELHREYERELQALALAEMIARHADPAGLPPILAGDFDAAPDRASIRFLTGRQSLNGQSVHFRDAWEEAGDGTEGFTWTSENPGVAELIHSRFHQSRHARRIDYIFLGSFHDYAKPARITRCEVALNAPVDGVYASDHYAVFAEIEVP